MKRVLPILLILLVCLYCGAPTVAIAEDKVEVKAGVSLVFTGAWAAWGESIRNGLMLGVTDAHNKFILDAQDDQCQPSQAVTNTNKFLSIDNNDLIFMGCMENLEAVAPLVRAKKKLLFALGGISDEILNRYGNIVSLNSYADGDARYVGPYIAQQPHIKKVAILVSTTTFGDALGAKLSEILKSKGLTVTALESTAVDTQDYRSLISRLQAGQPDAIFFHQGEESAVSLVKQIRQLGFKGDIFTSFTFENDAVRKSGGSFLDGVKYVYPINASTDSTELETFEKRFQEKFGTSPNANALMAYDGIILVDRAVTKCGVKNSECVKDFFATMGDSRGLAGDVHFEKNGGALRPYGLKQYKDGKFEWVEKHISL